MSEAEIDQEMLDSLKLILEDRFDLLLNTFISDSGTRKDRLKQAIDTSDFPAIRQEAHGLKGSSRNIGANKFADICAMVESQATREDNSRMEQNFAAIENGLAAVVAELKGLLP